ncbi:MAG TPA: hypothetical protein VNG95_06690 [Gemmatimonadales bacterium]|nr:hypothetical protein [Gemmatimonadales bacterium]
MNAAQQLELAQALHDALERAGILIERSQTSGGNVSAWISVPAVEVVGHLARRFKVSLVSSRPPLAIMRDEKTGPEL